jgi:hypothetical protein
MTYVYTVLCSHHSGVRIKPLNVVDVVEINIEEVMEFLSNYFMNLGFSSKTCKLGPFFLHVSKSNSLLCVTVNLNLSTSALPSPLNIHLSTYTVGPNIYELPLSTDLS